MSITKEILSFIYDAGELLPGFEFPDQYLRRLRKATYYGTVRRLEKRELIVKKKKGNITRYVITDKGRKLVEQNLSLKKRKDGSSTLVIFDIPEDKRKARKAFRRYLLKNGFKVLQKSVYISRNIVPKTIIEVTKELGLSSNVSVIGGRIEYYL